MTFSQRIGIKPAGKLVQRGAVDDELRNCLWSLLTLTYWDSHIGPNDGFRTADTVNGSNLETLAVRLWLLYFKKPVDLIDNRWSYWLAGLREYFFKAKWYEVYDFIEFIARNGPDEFRKDFINVTNAHLERENSAYRFVDERITEIASAEEIAEVETALANADAFAGVKTHLQTALSLMSDRQSPDFRNSIKESISAIESLAKRIGKDQNATLGEILRVLEKEKKLHPALRSAFSSLYGYTSDADGIRHAILAEPQITKADARFMLICCSAFINFVVDTVNQK
jgi:AbiJ N-terminal domain 4